MSYNGPDAYMPQNAPLSLNVVLTVGVGVASWYLYQIVSRKRETVNFKIRCAVVGLAIYLVVSTSYYCNSDYPRGGCYSRRACGMSSILRRGPL